MTASFFSNSPMDLNTRKEEFSYAYLQAIASVAGFSIQVKRRSMDAAGIDVTIETPGTMRQGGVSFPRIDAQVKCTSTRAHIHERSISFPLEAKNYNKLIGKDYLVPQILVLLIVPEKTENWVEIQEPNVTIIQKCAYWLSLKGRGTTQNQSTITVEIPRSNLLTAESLVELMFKVANREDL